MVLALLARGYTNREIAATLVISVKTASVHVSHILRKLGAPNRLDAAAIAHRLAPRPASQREPPYRIGQDLESASPSPRQGHTPPSWSVCALRALKQ